MEETNLVKKLRKSLLLIGIIGYSSGITLMVYNSMKMHSFREQKESERMIIEEIKYSALYRIYQERALRGFALSGISIIPLYFGFSIEPRWLDKR